MIIIYIIIFVLSSAFQLVDEVFERIKIDAGNRNSFEYCSRFKTMVLDMFDKYIYSNKTLYTKFRDISIYDDYYTCVSTFSQNIYQIYDPQLSIYPNDESILNNYIIKLYIEFDKNTNNFYYSNNKIISINDQNPIIFMQTLANKYINYRDSRTRLIYLMNAFKEGISLKNMMMSKNDLKSLSLKFDSIDPITLPFIFNDISNSVNIDKRDITCYTINDLNYLNIVSDNSDKLDECFKSFSDNNYKIIINLAKNFKDIQDSQGSNEYDKSISQNSFSLDNIHNSQNPQNIYNSQNSESSDKSATSEIFQKLLSYINSNYDYSIYSKTNKYYSSFVNSKLSNTYNNSYNYNSTGPENFYTEIIKYENIYKFDLIRHPKDIIILVDEYCINACAYAVKVLKYYNISTIISTSKDIQIGQGCSYVDKYSSSIDLDTYIIKVPWSNIFNFNSSYDNIFESMEFSEVYPDISALSVDDAINIVKFHLNTYELSPTTWVINYNNLTINKTLLESNRKFENNDDTNNFKYIILVIISVITILIIIPTSLIIVSICYKYHKYLKYRKCRETPQKLDKIKVDFSKVCEIELE